MAAEKIVNEGSATATLDGSDLTEAGIDASELVEHFQLMRLIRAFDACLPELYTKGIVRGSTHAAIGQEAVAVGACAALRPLDYITSTHRGHGHTIAKGAGVRRMMAELLGRVDGYCRGRGGSMHIADFSVGMLGANGIVGGGFALAGGAALSSLLLKQDRVALCFFGEGAINQGAFHEVSNMAGIWNLPLVLVCENNHWAMSARVEEMTAGGDLAGRAAAYGFPGTSVDGMDVVAVRTEVSRAVERARSGGGPSLVVAECFRFEGHFSGDQMLYRDKADLELWRNRDPIVLLRERLLTQGLADENELATIERRCDDEVREALEWAKLSPTPDPETVADDLHS
ncbi:thiamine pyrophosphate-dependent dehydrogenase E1 component subunit alpha [Streptomyces sp. NPDC051976]|uniref:thiamine pyrophosphate-dependent dehydrogenase E1 component subunit alpha n=1 Tax=Streptomyces sp. NPDC051976 TaxID=3154947 RepID=UPI00341CC3A9